MQIQKNISLATYSTMRLGGEAKYLVEVTNEAELTEALDYANNEGLQVHITGTGSNSIFSNRGFNGLVIVNRIMGIIDKNSGEVLELEVGSGENWDDIVRLSVKRGYFDIAALSLIPGTTGAAPIQNIGAYGQQISDSIEAVRVLERASGELKEIPKDDCNFTYRHSRFNTTDKNKFVVTSVIMRLHRKTISPPFYADVSNYLSEHQISEESLTPEQFREAVSTIRVIKLPDPGTVANCGSFFKNPVVTTGMFEQLQIKYPELKAHQTDDGNLKLYGAQLIELAGMKDFHDEATGMATWKNQALVLVNENAKTTDDLLIFKQKIVDNVEQLFGITLAQEPEFIELV